jgi:quinol monooxygenase YgiN
MEIDMSKPCLELVIFKVKDTDKARIARGAAQDTVKNYDGFISWTAYESCEEKNLFADVVLWRDLKTAKEAAEKVMKDPAFAAIMAEIDGLVTMSHFKADRVVEADALAA